MHIPLVAPNRSKHLLLLLISESPCLPIIPFHVLSSVPTCALKSPGRTIDSAHIAFYKATPTSSKKGWYCASAFGAYTCKMYCDRSCNLSLRRQTLPPSEIQSVTQWGKQGLTQKCLPLPEQTWLHLNLSRKASSLHSTQQYQSHGTW